jgi:hypothetical protein
VTLNLSINQSISQASFAYQSIYLSIYVSIYLSINQSISQASFVCSTEHLVLSRFLLRQNDALICLVAVIQQRSVVVSAAEDFELRIWQSKGEW